jgi:4-amino-4-deoxy-L-arabinose transferase-like glycosyltransferase
MGAEQHDRAGRTKPGFLRNVSLDHILKRLIFVLGILTLVLMVFVAKFDYLSDPNAIDVAQIARNLAEGRGYTTSVITPLALSTGISPQLTPDITRPPLYVSVLALAMRIGGTSDKTVAFVSIIFLLLTLVLVYRLGRRFFDDRVGIYSVAICAISTGLMMQATSGLETTLLALLVTLLFGVLLLHARSAEPTAMRWPLLSGLVLGLCYLVRLECLALLPAVLLYWVFAGGRQRWSRMLIVAAAFVVVALPWVVRTNLVTGRVGVSTLNYELIMNTIAHPGQTLSRQFIDVPQLPVSIALRHPLQMLRKLNFGMRAAYNGLPQLLNPYLLGLFLASLLIRPIRERYGLVQWSLMAAIFGMSIATALYANVLRLLLAFAPIVVVFATAGFMSYVDDYTGRRRPSKAAAAARWFRTLALCGWVLLLAYPMADLLFAVPPSRQAPMVQVMREVGKAGDLIVTDVPWYVAWYGHKRALLLPQSVGQLEALRNAGVRPDTVYLSPTLLSIPRSENMAAWQQYLFSDRPLDGFQRSRTWKNAGALWKSTATTPK